MDPVCRRRRLDGSLRGESFRRERGRAFLLLLPLALVTACNWGRIDGEGAGPTAGSRVITQEEVSTLSVSTAWDVVERLRPLWLRSSGARSRSARLDTEVVVVTDGQYFGGLPSLRQIPAGGVREIRYLTGSEAVNAYPRVASGRHVEAAIVISQGARVP